MKKKLIQTVLKLLSLLPLSAIRALGAFVGLMSLRFSKRSANRLRENLLLTGIATPENVEALARSNAKAMGMTLSEAALIGWQKNQKYIKSLFETDENFDKCKEILASGKNILFLTPHVGNFELGIKYYAYTMPMDINILYKPSKDTVLNEIMLEGRTEENVTPQPTNRKGVLSLIKHFKSGGTLGILPDNVASGGDGEWVKFFGHDVYATSLSAKICQMPDTITVLVNIIRTAKGFKTKNVFFTPSSNDTHTIMQELYQAIESLIEETPEQYYWSYDRFRNVDHAKAKPSDIIEGH